MKAVAEKKPEAERVVPEFRDAPKPIGYALSDYSVAAPDGMTPEDLTNPIVWALVKENSRGFELHVGDSLRVVHRDWIAAVVVDRGGRGQACHVLVESVLKRQNYAASRRDLMPSDHDAVLDPVTGYWRAIFYRGPAREEVELGEYSVEARAIEECRDHATRVAPGR